MIIPPSCKIRFANMLMAVVALTMDGGLACKYPVAPAAALAAFLLWCMAVAWRPGIWLFLVPAALPLQNLGPWIGWVVFEEIDLLLHGVIAGANARVTWIHAAKRGEPSEALRDRLFFVGMAALFAVLGAAALVGGMSAAGGAFFG